MTGESALIRAVARLATIYFDMNLSKGSFKHQLNLSALPLLGQRELRLVKTLLVGNTLRRRFTIETHTVLIGAETLQFPA